VIASGRTLLVAGASAAALAVVAVPATAAARETAPRVRARPHRVMVGSATTLRGRGFPPDAQIELRECGRTFWLEPEEPCDTANALSVTTDGKGAFTATLHVELCPEGEPGRRGPTERVCWIGERRIEEDTGALLGAGRLAVTYP